MTERSMNMKAKRYLELKAEYDALEKQMEKLKKEMQEEIGEETVYETDKYTFKLPFISRDVINTKEFKEQRPDLFNIFNKTIQYRKFSVAEKGN